MRCWRIARIVSEPSRIDQARIRFSRVFRLGNMKQQHAGHIEPLRKMAAHGREVLESNLRPDTFAGRKTREPFPRKEV